MHFFSNLPIMISMFAIKTSTAPVQQTARACIQDTTFNAKFEKLALGTSPPTNFAGAGWSGWTVVDPYASVGLNAKSGTHAIQAGNPETSSIYATQGVLIEIQSFYFGCSAVYPGLNEVFPSSCAIVVTQVPNTESPQGIFGTGPYSFLYNISSQEPGNMTRADLGVTSSQFYFQVVAGLATTMLYLDNVVITSQDISCH